MPIALKLVHRSLATNFGLPVENRAFNYFLSELVISNTGLHLIALVVVYLFLGHADTHVSNDITCPCGDHAIHPECVFEGHREPPNPASFQDLN